MATIELVKPGRLKVSGVLDFNTVVPLQAQGVELLKTAERECEIDFSEVTRAGSAGVSLLLSWLRCAIARDIKVVFSHLPEDLLGVARVSGVDKFLPVTS